MPSPLDTSRVSRDNAGLKQASQLQVMIRFNAAFPGAKTGLALARARQNAHQNARRGARVWGFLGVGMALSCLAAVSAGAKPSLQTKSKAKAKAVFGRRVVPTASEAASLLGPDDVISVTVLRHPELSDDTLTIPASGQIVLPEAGTVRVAGQTPTQAAQSIARALSRTLVFPEVAVKIKQARERRVVVIGAVAKTSSYIIKAGWRISDALAAAGGLPGGSHLDETAGTLTRAGSLPINIDLKSVFDNPSSPQNLRLREGDTLSFSALDIKTITVSGDVKTAGRFPLRQARRLLDALTLAGGTTQNTERTRVTLFRDGQEQALDLAQAELQNTPQFNVSLQSGDFLLVKSVPLLQVTVTGPFVRNSGNYQLAPGAGVAQAVAQAGGATVPFDQVVATIARGQRIIAVDLARAALDPRANIALQSGDAVFVNEPKIIRVQVAGAVNKQGALRIAPGTTLLDALNGGAGGLSILAAEARINVVRTLSSGAQLLGVSAPLASAAPGNALDGATQAGGASGLLKTQVTGDRQVIAVDAVALIGRTDLSQNVVLQDGDLVSVTQVKDPTVIISGQVVKTGPYQIVPGEGVTQLLARAGGATGDAALTRVVLQRGGQSRVLDVYNEVTLGQKTNVTLENGDTVIVPENISRVIVMNAVQKPGSYAIPEHRILTVTDAINLAGGARDRAAPKQIGLLRPNPRVQGGVERRVLDFDKFGKGDLSQNVALLPGDIVFVPEARAPRAGLLNSLGQVVGAFTGLRILTGR